MSARQSVFQETLKGTLRLIGEHAGRPVRLDLSIRLPGVLHPLSDLEGPLTGHVHVPGWADDTAAAGTVRVAPLRARHIRYRIGFTTLDGRRLHLDGWKSVRILRPVRSMTALPVTITDADGSVLGQARLRFHVRQDLLRMLATLRFPRDTAGTELFRSRWRGQPGRLEVWYTTLTDPATQAGVWLHHELLAPADGGAARAHGWAAVFPKGESPAFARFGPSGWPDPATGFRCGDVEATVDLLRGHAGELSWDLRRTGDGGAALYTFPRWAWERELLPAAQIVAAPTTAFSGTVRFGDRALTVSDAPGATARIYGHGNAERWAWLHADLGDGDVCEVVTAVSTRPVLKRLPPLSFVRLRVGGLEWPRRTLLTALRMRAALDLPTWRVRGRIGDRLLHIEVTQPPQATIAVDYTDPDGAPAVCHNCERADAVIRVSRRAGGRWVTERTWRLDGTAHAEVGRR